MLFGHVWEVVFIAGLVGLILWIIWRTARTSMGEAAPDRLPEHRDPVDIDSAVMDQVWRDFPRHLQHDAAAALATYGEQPYEREVVRVQLAILAIAGGDMERLLKYVEHAKRDYRDVLMWSVQAPHSPAE
jgi:hypothetical protein